MALSFGTAPMPRLADALYSAMSPSVGRLQFQTMPLHISIDVDLTIVDSDRQLMPGVRECLQALQAKKSPDGQRAYSLQLWSSCGKEYAEAIANRFNLHTLFDSFASKPDLVVDDMVTSSFPRSAIQVDQSLPFADAMKQFLTGAKRLA
jgi:hypothetical protein